MAGTPLTEKVSSVVARVEAYSCVVRFANNDEVINIVEYVLYPSLANDPFNTISNCSENNGGLMEAEGEDLVKVQLAPLPIARPGVTCLRELL